MLFAYAKLAAGQTILIQAAAAASARRRSSSPGRRRAGHHHRRSDEKAVKAKALGADHVINYREERFEAWCGS